ncbi:hypothetical protein JOQ06_012209 [Pogonophryne albipinna]|uniref:Uncharacterized protein n=1 Tax=Pogonophryne albipinna TaxID=1090488 RepID=A0AAD6BCR3_9TELE|nr:hypothetical protein JOQ06_012209 [Pogonophryne albipinna]
MHLSRSIKRCEKITSSSSMLRAKRQILQIHAVCVQRLARSERQLAPRTSSRYGLTQEQSFVYMAAETSRCGSANNSCALTADQSGENRIKCETEAPGQRKWMGAAATGLGSFVCAPFIHHLCFLGNRGLPVGNTA